MKSTRSGPFRMGRRRGGEPFGLVPVWLLAGAAIVVGAAVVAAWPLLEQADAPANDTVRFAADTDGAQRRAAAGLAAGAPAAAAPGAAGAGPTAPGGALDPVAADTPSADTLPVDVGPVDAADFAVGIDAVAAAERVSKPSEVRGIYLNVWAAASRARRSSLMTLADETEINAFVIDVKDATGRVSYPSTVPFVRRIDADGERRIRDVRTMLEELKARGIYPIARIVVFKDPMLAHTRPDWAIQDDDGGTWQDHHGEFWVDPYNRKVWDYNIALAREALSLGFAEVQWDYVRFPDVPQSYMESAVFPAREGRTRADAIREFLQYSERELADLDAPITADVFGLTVSANGDMGIGQDWHRMVDVVDVLLPMVYPSHFHAGSYGIEHPNSDPYHTILIAMEHAIRRTQDVPGGATIRPWLQDFSLGEPSYGPAEVRAQIEAVYDAGLTEWVLWNSASRYTAAALAPKDGEPPRFPIPGRTLPGMALDSLPAPDIDVRAPNGARLLGTPANPLPAPRRSPPDSTGDGSSQTTARGIR